MMSRTLRLSTSFLLFITLCSLNCFSQEIVTVKSPDGNIEVLLRSKNGSAFYSILAGDQIFLQDSSLGLETSIGDFSENLKFISSKHSAISETYHLNRAKVSQVDYEANELEIPSLMRIMTP